MMKNFEVPGSQNADVAFSIDSRSNFLTASASRGRYHQSMSVGTGQFSEAERLRLREVADAIDRELSCLGRADTPEAYQASASKFAASWAEMLEVLALGPAPDMRVCHRCGHLGRRAATRCGYCWAELPPLAPIAVRH